jgi:hypothetical protein
VLTKRSLKQIAGDEGSAAWESSRKASTRGGSSKNDWLADSIAKADAKKAKAAKKSAGVKAVPVAAKNTAKRAVAKTSSVVKKNSALLKKKA